MCRYVVVVYMNNINKSVFINYKEKLLFVVVYIYIIDFNNVNILLYKKIYIYMYRYKYNGKCVLCYFFVLWLYNDYSF